MITLYNDVEFMEQEKKRKEKERLDKIRRRQELQAQVGVHFPTELFKITLLYRCKLDNNRKIKKKLNTSSWVKASCRISEIGNRR